VRVVDSARAALAALDGWPAHVLVSDIGMPGEDGYALMRGVRALPDERALIPAVAVTAFAAAADSRHAMMAGYQMHVPKPVQPERLVRVVAELARWSRR
jgi:CheY-like chemotaxis protein